jgi:hypothetical protein
VAVVQIGGRDRGQQQATVRVGEGMALAAHHAPGRVEAAPTRDAHPARASRLGINNGVITQALAARWFR